jgi:hypothetical protein
VNPTLQGGGYANTPVAKFRYGDNVVHQQCQQ